MNYDDKGNVISCFSPPRDADGRTLSYPEWRERRGDPIGPEEERLMVEIRFESDRIYARAAALGRRETVEDLVPLWRLERQLLALREPAHRLRWRAQRASAGIPVTAEEECLKDQAFSIEMTRSCPWTQDELKRFNTVHAELRAIEKRLGYKRSR